MMRVKLNRGPMKNKYMLVDNDWQDVLRVTKPVPPTAFFNHDPSEPILPIYGEYRRSNVTLKNGAVVFEWMGWRE